MIECPECAGGITTPSDVMTGEIVPCAHCGAELEVTETTPLALAAAPEVQEDWGE
ncbi:MAG: lysine biosynthesis protein LysW [Planctomycetes bacterium]|nr:lysine biosynthesis protein LysW [Planctomycetota bacterium]